MLQSSRTSGHSHGQARSLATSSTVSAATLVGYHGISDSQTQAQEQNDLPSEGQVHADTPCFFFRNRINHTATATRPRTPVPNSM